MQPGGLAPTAGLPAEPDALEPRGLAVRTEEQAGPTMVTLITEKLQNQSLDDLAHPSCDAGPVSQGAPPGAGGQHEGTVSPEPASLVVGFQHQHPAFPRTHPGMFCF